MQDQSEIQLEQENQNENVFTMNIKIINTSLNSERIAFFCSEGNYFISIGNRP